MHHIHDHIQLGVAGVKCSW